MHKKHFADLIYYFCPLLVDFFYLKVLNMGIQCKTGAVPAAVSLDRCFFTPCHCSSVDGWEGTKKQGKPENLPKC